MEEQASHLGSRLFGQRAPDRQCPYFPLTTELRICYWRNKLFLLAAVYLGKARLIGMSVFPFDDRVENLLLEEQASHLLEAARMKVDYVHISRSGDLQPAKKVDKEIVILASVYLGKARLIGMSVFPFDD